MSASRLTTVTAILRKDLIILWPLIVASLVLPVGVVAFSEAADLGLDPNLKVWAAGLGLSPPPS